MDETLNPYRTKNDSIAGSKGRSHDGRMAIVAVELPGYELTEDTWKTTAGRIRLAAIPDFSRQTLHGFLHATVAKGRS